MKRRIILLLFAACLSGISAVQARAVKAGDALFITLANKDSLLFDIAFNTCNVEAINTVLWIIAWAGLSATWMMAMMPVWILVWRKRRCRSYHI